jgi:hypothetical protein
MRKNPLLPRLLKKVQMPGGARWAGYPPKVGQGVHWVRRNECPSKRGTRPEDGSPQMGLFQQPSMEMCVHIVNTHHPANRQPASRSLPTLKVRRFSGSAVRPFEGSRVPRLAPHPSRLTTSALCSSVVPSRLAARGPSAVRSPIDPLWARSYHVKYGCAPGNPRQNPAPTVRIFEACG